MNWRGGSLVPHFPMTAGGSAGGKPPFIGKGTGGRLIRNPPHYLHGWEGAAVGSIAFENSSRRCNDATPLALSQEGLTGLLTNRFDQMPGDDVPTCHAAGECRPLVDQLPLPMAAFRFVYAGDFTTLPGLGDLQIRRLSYDRKSLRFRHFPWTPASWFPPG